MGIRTSVSVVVLASPVRLKSESGRTEDLSAGRLEIFINGQWGTVCDELFGITEAHVACRQLGFLQANSYTNTRQIGFVIANANLLVINSSG